MRITVITVCLNAADTIEQTIQSVLQQDYGDVEYIIVDGMSTDSTLDIINKYRDKIALLIREPDEGLYDAMNKGVLHSSGEIISFMNADDRFASPDVLRRMAEAFGQHPDKMIIYGDCIIGEGTAQVLKRHPDSIGKRSLGITWLNHQSIFYRRSAFDVVGLFDNGYPIYGDYDWNVRAFFVHRLSHLHLPVTVCIFRRGGISGGPWPGRIAQVRAIHKKHLSLRERLCCWPFTFVRKVSRRVATRNFALPVAIRTFVKERCQGLASGKE